MMRRRRPDYDASHVKVNKKGLKKLIRLYRYVLPEWKNFALGLVFLVFSSLITLIFPALMGDLLDAANDPDSGYAGRIALILMGIFTLSGIFSYFRIYLFAIVTQKTLARIRQATYEHLIKLPMSFFGERRVGELNSRMSADIAQLEQTFSTTLAQFIRQGIIIIGGITLLAYISPRLTLFMLILVVVIVLVALFIGRYIRKISRETQNTLADSNTIVEETLQGIQSVKAYTNELYETLRYRKSTNEVIDIALRGAKWRGAFAAFVVFALFGSIVGTIWYGIYLIQHGADITTGGLFKFILYSVFVGGSIGGIADMFSQIQKAIGATENLLELFDEEAEDFEVGAEEVQRLPGAEIEFSNVDFHYPQRVGMKVLKDVNFRIGKGEMVALVGTSGAGKTTITNLLLRFFDPVSGEILINGKNIKDYPLQQLRNNIAIVPQELLLFGGTIRENIAYGKPGASDDEIRAAAEQANAMEFIDSFPDGINTIVGERGVQLSGGQRQRIAIARAILNDPVILVLDEATSNLDTLSETLIQEALEKLMPGRTSLVIAHRLSTIRKASYIIVLENGRIFEHGSHDDLIALDGMYKKLSLTQSLTTNNSLP